MNTPIAVDSEKLECRIIQPKKIRASKNYANAPRRQSKRV